jgi:Ribbon-helix-helix domain
LPTRRPVLTCQGLILEDDRVKAVRVRYYGGTDPGTGQADEKLPENFDLKLVSVDCAFKDLATSDFVAISVIGIKGRKRFVLNVVNKHLDAAATEAEIRRQRGVHRPLCVVNNRLITYTDRWIYAYMTRNSMSEPETTRLTITWSKEADHALRTFLGSQGMKKGDLSKFIEEAVRWRIFHQTVREAREAFADVSPYELQKMIDEAVEDARAKYYRGRAKRS